MAKYRIAYLDMSDIVPRQTSTELEADGYEFDVKSQAATFYVSEGERRRNTHTYTSVQKVEEI